MDHLRESDPKKNYDPRFDKLENAIHSNIYLPTRAYPFRTLLASSHILKTGAFVDYGAGLGRPMIIASQQGFKTVRGIEFSRKLFDVGKEIIKTHSNLSPEINFDYILDDAINYKPQNSDTVFYFYDPFSKVILNQCLDSIIDSVAKNPRRIQIIYHYNLKKNFELPLKNKAFSLKKTFTCMGNQFFIYQNHL